MFSGVLVRVELLLLDIRMFTHWTIWTTRRQPNDLPRHRNRTGLDRQSLSGCDGENTKRVGFGLCSGPPPRRFLQAHTRSWGHGILLCCGAHGYPTAHGEFTPTDAERQKPLPGRNKFAACCRHCATEAERIPRDKFKLDAGYVYWRWHAFTRHRVHLNRHCPSFNGAASRLPGKFMQGA